MHEGQAQKANCSISADQTEAQSEVKSAEYEVEFIFKTQLITNTCPFDLLYKEFSKVVNFYFFLAQNMPYLGKI